MNEFKKLLKWSKGEFNNLPWRRERTLYRTLVSEIMLQQTTVATVLNHFEKFVSKYPTIEALATVTEEQIQIDWKGLGYYRRARNLRNAAKYIFESQNGNIPTNFEDLISIPGIGDYTANALLAIGSNKKALALDANIERVLSRYFLLDTEGLSVTKKYKFFKDVFNDSKYFQLKSFRSYRALNEAFMDVGRVYCKARAAHCELCPLNEECSARKKGVQQDLISNKKKQVGKYYQVDLLRCVVKRKNQILVERRKKGFWLEGQLELPTFIVKSEDKNLKQYLDKKLFSSKLSVGLADDKNMKPLRTTITKYKIKNYIKYLSYEKFKLEDLSETDWQWVSLSDERFSTATIKLLKRTSSE